LSFYLLRAVVNALSSVPNELFISSAVPESSPYDLDSVAPVEAKLEGMVVDEGGAQSTNVAGTGLATRQARDNLLPLSYFKPTRRISTNDIMVYLAEEAAKNGEHFELSATAGDLRLDSL
jgi:hypothetical protein